jgi:molecular chaperone DnaK (HSP70)
MGFLSRCRKQKEFLSMYPQKEFSEILPPPGFHRVKMLLDRQKFEKLIHPIVGRTIHKTKLLLDKIQQNNYPLDTAIMIGGSSRIPLIYDLLSELLPIKPQKVMAVDVAVALGAVCGSITIPSPPKSESKPEATRPEYKPCYCIHEGCGKQIHRGVKFCWYCGKENFMYNK